jgi:hypothetical protein
MSLSQILESRKRFAKEWKIVGWTVGIMLGVYLTTDGRTISDHPFQLQHLLIGAALGFVLGYLFSQRLRDTDRPSGKLFNWCQMQEQKLWNE